MAKKKKNENGHDFKITCFHVNNEVTGSAFLMQVDGLNIVLDMGLYQNQSKHLETVYKINNEKFAIPLNKVDYIVLTSSHADHCGNSGLAGREDLHFKGKCICTSLSQELIALNLYDSAYLMDSECEAYNKKHNTNIKPLYTKYDVERVMENLRGYGYNEKILLNSKVSVELLPNGHLSGDCSILVTYEKDEYTKKSVLYLGDHNYGKKNPKPFTKIWEEKNIKPCCVLTESTYASEIQNQEDNVKKLEKYILSEVLDKKHTLIMPSFAIHRSTELAYLLKRVWNKNEQIRNADIPIYMCGNMMAKAHRIIGNPKYKEFYDKQWQELDDLFNWSQIRGIESFKDLQSKTINQTPKIIIASGGMINSYSKYLMSCYISQKKCSILFSGYQAIDTLGRKILENEHKSISIDGKQLVVRATILDRLSMSGHADDKGLRGIFNTINLHNLKKVLIVHGEDYKKEVLKEELESDLPNSVEILIPKSKEIIKI